MCRVIHEEPIEPVHQPEPGAAVFEPVADFLFHYYPDLPAGRISGGDGAHCRVVRHGISPLPQTKKRQDREDDDDHSDDVEDVVHRTLQLS